MKINFRTESLLPKVKVLKLYVKYMWKFWGNPTVLILLNVFFQIYSFRDLNDGPLEKNTLYNK